MSILISGSYNKKRDQKLRIEVEEYLLLEFSKLILYVPVTVLLTSKA